MTKEEIVKYVMNSPQNTNENVLRSLLSNFEEEIKNENSGDLYKGWLKIDSNFTNLSKSTMANFSNFKQLIIPVTPGKESESIPESTFAGENGANLTYLGFEYRTEPPTDPHFWPYTIYRYAFAGTGNLKEIHFNKVKVSIGEGVFSGSGVETIDGIGEGSGFSSNCIAGCSNLKTLYIPARCDLPSNCFGSSGLNKVYLHKDINSLGNQVFSGCTYLTDIYCGFSEGAFENFTTWGDGITATVHYDVPELQ